jgi:hypothetical protein
MVQVPPRFFSWRTMSLVAKVEKKGQNRNPILETLNKSNEKQNLRIGIVYWNNIS